VAGGVIAKLACDPRSRTTYESTHRHPSHFRRSEATPKIWEGQRAQAKPSTLGVGSKMMSVVALVIAPLIAL
jgi:hypothetical protein